MVRALMQLQSVTENCYNKNSKTLRFSVSYDSRIPEAQRFYDSTPSGSFEMTVNNPEALAQLELGKFYYFDVHEAPPFETK